MTDCIRDGLRNSGLLSVNEQTLSQLRSLNLTEAEKGNVATYRGLEGSVIQFHQNAKGGFHRGERYCVKRTHEDCVELVGLGNDKRQLLPTHAAERFEVYSESELQIAPGDKVRFSLGGSSLNGGKRISNGRLDEVKRFDAAGNMVLKSGLVVDRNFGHVDLGYVITSHASQGKDRQVAIAAMGAESLPAINARQFYVTVSRGSEDVAIFVDNREKVRRAIARSGEELSATEMLRGGEDEHTLSEDLYRDRRLAEQHRDSSYRQRLSHWWKERQTDRGIGQEVGRHRQDVFEQSANMDFSRGLERE